MLLRPHIDTIRDAAIAQTSLGGLPLESAGALLRRIVGVPGSVTFPRQRQRFIPQEENQWTRRAAGKTKKINEREQESTRENKQARGRVAT